jgi:dihydroorotase
VVLIDPAARAVVDRDASVSLSRNNPWHGRELPDPVVATIWAGRITYQKER